MTNSNLPGAQLLAEFVEAYNTRDIDKMINLFAHDAILWGTGNDEYRTGRNEIEQQVKRDWAQSESGKIIPKGEVICPPEHPLWAAGIYTAKITIGGEEHTFDNLRGTIVASHEEGGWKIFHMHASFPENSQLVGESFPRISSSDHSEL